MSLNKRLILLLLPVILLGYAGAIFVVYQYQKSNIVELAQAQLEQRMYQLKSIYKEESSIVDNLMGLFLEGSSLENFLSAKPSSYRELALSQSLNLLISQSLLNKTSRIAFALFDGSGNNLYFYERSANPFATLSDEQKSLAKYMLVNRLTSYRQFDHLQQENLLLIGKLLDKVGGVPFKGRDLQDSVQLSFAIYMTQFSDYLAALSKSYQTQAVWSQRPAQNGFVSSIQVAPHQYVTIRPAATVLDKPLFTFLIKLTLVASLFAVLTYGLLVFLIARFITAPVKELDKELTLVMHYQKENILPPKGRSEIGRLGQKFYSLFDQLQDNLRKTHAMAITDSLTSLPNRSRFYEYAKHTLIKAEQAGYFVSLIYIDLDNFKFVNDKLGHEAGDELLCFLSEDLDRLIDPIQKQRGGCMVSRLSGDEFAIVLTHNAEKDSDDLAKIIVSLFDGGYESENYYFPVSASIGIATYPSDGKSLKELIANADMAMYHAKRSGKNRFNHYSLAIASEARRVKNIENHLKMADCESEFSLVYMPFTDGDGKVKGFEVLIRWHSPELGEVDPDEFIPIAEQTGTYAKIDNWVFETAFSNLGKIRKIFGDDCILSINISAAELGHHLVLDRLVELKEQYNIDDKSIELELTETFSYVQTDLVLDVLNGLQSAGFNIAIDDFGTGFTPLLQMIDYPVNKVKLDKVLTDRVTTLEYAKLLPPLIELCHLQNIAVTAEGIETEYQMQRLREAGCDYFQGYWLSQPMSFDYLEAWYKSYQAAAVDV